MSWTTTDELNVIPKTQRMSLASFPGLYISISGLKKWHPFVKSCIQIRQGIKLIHTFVVLDLNQVPYQRRWLAEVLQYRVQTVSNKAYAVDDIAQVPEK